MQFITRGSQIEVSPHEVGTQSGLGVITWNLPSSIPDYAGEQLTVLGDIYNPTQTNQVYAAMILFLDSQGRPIQGSEQLYDWDGYGAIMLRPGYVVPFGFTASNLPQDYYLAMQLWSLKPVGGDMYELDKVIDQVQCFLGKRTPEFAFGDIIGLILPIMMLGMIMPMMRDMGKKE